MLRTVWRPPRIGVSNGKTTISDDNPNWFYWDWMWQLFARSNSHVWVPAAVELGSSPSRTTALSPAALLEYPIPTASLTTRAVGEDTDSSNRTVRVFVLLKSRPLRAFACYLKLLSGALKCTYRQKQVFSGYTSSWSFVLRQAVCVEPDFRTMLQLRVKDCAKDYWFVFLSGSFSYGKEVKEVQSPLVKEKESAEYYGIETLN